MKSKNKTAMQQEGFPETMRARPRIGRRLGLRYDAIKDAEKEAAELSNEFRKAIGLKVRTA